MATDGLDDATIRRLLRETRRIAMVGASPRPERPSHGVMRFLLDRGFAVTPVNPAAAGTELHGQPILASLAEAEPLDMVDVFRASEHVPALMEEAIRHGARSVWMQLGVVSEAAAAAGRAAGLVVVMDRCPAIEWRRLGL